MAFYGTYGKKEGREQKRKNAEMRGGIEDEGTRYTGARQGGRSTSRSSERPAQGRGVRTGTSGRGAPRPQGNSSYEGRAPRPQGGNGYEGRSPRPQGSGSYENRSSRPQGNGYEGRSPRPQGGNGYEGRSPRPQGSNSYEGQARPQRSGYQGKSESFRKGGNEYRFARDAGQRYSERGSGFSPRPYGEQREAREQERPAGRPQYAPRPQPSRESQGMGSAEDYRYAAPATYQSNIVVEGMDAVPAENLLSGRNPIREALKSGRDIEKLLVARGELSGSAREIVKMAKEKHIPVQEVDRVRLDAITHNHQGMLAFASAYQYKTVQDMLDLAEERGEAPFLVILDGITDPHNLGAVIRTAECVGAHGVIVQERRAVGLTPAAVKASAGAIEHMPVARVTNLTATLFDLKQKNIWAFAADMAGEDYTKVDFSGAVALVIGAEGEGVSRRVLDTCDKRVSLPIRGKIESLNASVAAGVLLYAAMRAR